MGDSLQLLRNKRESFRVEIRRKAMETIFSQKRK